MSMLYEAYSSNELLRESREDELFMTIENLRCELLEIARQRSLSDRAVVELSERLDEYILLAQHRMMGDLRSRREDLSSVASASGMKSGKGPYTQ